MAVNVAAGQINEDKQEGKVLAGEPDEKVKTDKPDDTLILCGLSPMILQGIPAVRQETAMAAYDTQTLPMKNDGLSSGTVKAVILSGSFDKEAAVPGSQGGNGMAEAVSGRPAVNEKTVPAAGGSGQEGLYGNPAFGNLINKTNTPVSGSFNTGATNQVKGMETAAQQHVPDLTGQQGKQSAKGTDENAQTAYRDAWQIHMPDAYKKVEYANGDTGEEVITAPDSLSRTDIAASVEKASFNRPDPEKEKPAQISAQAVAALKGTEKAIHTQSISSANETVQETAVHEDTAAMQLFRATVHALNKGTTEYRIRLRPEGLGEVEVKVVAEGNSISLSMRTGSEATRGLILGHADELRTELGAQHYHVSGLSVEVGMENRSSAGYDFNDYTETVFENGSMDEELSASESAAPLSQSAQRYYGTKNSTISYRI